ncbi:MAG TPA: hypothetical protein PLX35_11900 [Cyclobacteriaceae bacterium]|nr:hypothetical protein [Cyclobacteriaceae bacterium]
MRTSKAILLTIVLELLLIVAPIWLHGISTEALQLITRYSGRLSLLIFAFLFIGHRQYEQVLQSLLSPDYFLVFAIAHGIHLLELLSYVYLAGVELVPYRVAGGFIAYSLIFAMPWFQIRYMSGSFSTKNFVRVSWIYCYYVWLIFFMTYLGRLKGQFQNASPEVEHWAGMILVVILFIWKTSTLLIRKQTTPSAP